MTRVRDKVKICTINGAKCVEVDALFDTGASFTYISDKLGKELGYQSLPKPRKVPLAVEEMEGEVIGHESYIFTVAGCEMPLPHGVNVMKDLKEKAIIGTDFMEAFGIELDLREGKVRLKKCPPEVTLF